MSNRLANIYNTFWTDLQVSIPRGNEIFPKDSPFRFDDTLLPDCIVVYSKILFKRCNFRSSSGRRKIDILIDTKETFRILKGKKNSPDQYKFIKSTVSIFKMEESNKKP